MNLRNKSYNQLAKAAERHMKDIRKDYSKLRSIVSKRVKRFEASGIELSPDDLPHFPTLDQMIDTRDLLHTYMDIVNYYNRGLTLTAYKKQQIKALTTLRSRGWEVGTTEKDYNRFVEFIRWFRDSAYAALFDSGSEEVHGIYASANERGRSRHWNKLFKQYVKENNL